uniref:Uncharacterized protein n=1 Tax=Glossina palpalis gambiensis TaxID=67801 RepID=A0A1B0B1B0_9MUSC
MLRPTSCGPGPPSQDTVHEFSINFKNNKTNEKPIQYQQQYQQQQQEQEQQQQQQQQQRQQSTPTTIQAKQPKNINKCRKNNNNNNNNKKSKRNGKFSLKSLEYSSQLLKTMFWCQSRDPLSWIEKSQLRTKFETGTKVLLYTFAEH